MGMGFTSFIESYDLTCQSGVWECIRDLMLINQNLAERLTSANRHIYGQSSEKSAYNGITLLDTTEEGRKRLEEQGRASADQVPEPPKEPLQETEVKAYKRQKKSWKERIRRICLSWK